MCVVKAPLKSPRISDTHAPEMTDRRLRELTAFQLRVAKYRGLVNRGP